MKDAIRKKLKNSDGASILMALLLLLVAVMVSAVILSAAVSAAKTIRTDREAQQTYLTVSSAAEFMRDSVLGGCGGYSKTTTAGKKNYYRSWYSRNPSKTTDINEKGETEAEGSFSTLLNDAIKAVMETPTLTYVKSFTIRDEDGNYEQVNADFSLAAEKGTGSGETNYVLNVIFTGGSGDHQCRMTLRMTGIRKQESSETVTTERTYSYTEGYYISTATTTTTTYIDWTQTSATITRERVAQQ